MLELIEVIQTHTLSSDGSTNTVIIARVYEKIKIVSAIDEVVVDWRSGDVRVGHIVVNFVAAWFP